MVKGKDTDGDDVVSEKPKTRKRRTTITETSNDFNESQDTTGTVTLPEPTKKRRSTSKKAASEIESRETNIVVDNETGEDVNIPEKKVKPPSHQVITEKDEIPKLWDDEKAEANRSYSKICIYSSAFD